MRLVGWLASLVGVAGVVAGNGLASVVWVLMLAIRSRVRDLLALPDGGLEIATTLTEAVAGGITEMSAQIGDVRDAAEHLASGPSDDTAAAARLAAAIDTFAGGPYATFRVLYQRLRDRAIAVGDALARLGSGVPLLSVPPAAVERLQAIDARMTQIGASVDYLVGLGAPELAGPGIAARIAEDAATAQSTLASVGEMVAGVDGWIDDSRTRLAQQERRLLRGLTAGTLVASVAGLVFAGLNVLLFQQGRRWSGRR